MGTDSITAPAGFILDEEPTPPAGFVLDQPKTLSGAAHNLGQDIKENVKGLVQIPGMVDKSMSQMAFENKGFGETPAGEFVKNIPSSIVKEGKRLGAGELLTGHPINAAEKFGNAAYEKPLTTGMDAMALFGLGKGAVNAARGGGEAAALTAEAAPKAVTESAAPPPVEAAPPVAAAAAIPNAPAAPPPVPDLLAQATAKAPELAAKANDVKNYISRGYEGFSKKPGMTANIADYIQEKSQMMAAQQMGATPLQARQIGHEGMRALGQYALDHDIVGATTGLKGMRAKQLALNEAAGKSIGALRNEADALRNQLTTPVDVLQEVKAKLDPVFSRGSRSGEAGSYAKAIEELEDSKPTFHGVADVATRLNKAANAAQRVNQPHGAFTDVANIISDINNERIKAVLGPKKAAQYEQALRDFGATKKIGEFLKRKEAGEVKRFGPGSVTSNLAQKAMDEAGYKIGAKVANKVSTSILKNPSIARSIPSLFKEFINQVEDIGHDVTGMSEGGVVPPPMAEFVNGKANR